jgi:hypothetical protein
MNVEAGGRELLLRGGGRGTQRDGLKLTLTRAAGQRNGRGQNQSEGRKHEPKLFHDPLLQDPLKDRSLTYGIRSLDFAGFAG